LPPTSGTSVLRSSPNQRMQGDALISISPIEHGRYAEHCRAPGGALLGHVRTGVSAFAPFLEADGQSLRLDLHDIHIKAAVALAAGPTTAITYSGRRCRRAMVATATQEPSWAEGFRDEPHRGCRGRRNRQTLHRLGGELRFDTRVEKVMVENGRAVGVSLAGGSSRAGTSASGRRKSPPFSEGKTLRRASGCFRAGASLGPSVRACRDQGHVRTGSCTVSPGCAVTSGP